ncbi:hypothetical protein BN873_10071 [Candidatus Competibacter denitrificans Run_A_D11]|uniref:Uncharacterized protein n=1 Tax=Candidatus Competibacter denitrificans Run_A_D11 TaxID=1400863 RepID=W6M4S0_9GAMM|nr:hypothetical protein BN873_10071 [Candidatus Competibacter denitrificans Run_A_D11]
MCSFACDGRIARKQFGIQICCWRIGLLDQYLMLNKMKFFYGGFIAVLPAIKLVGSSVSSFDHPHW